MLFEITPAQSINEMLTKMHSGDILVLNDGVYHEKVEIWIDRLSLRAKNLGKAIITNKDYYHKIMEDQNECNTFRTYTVYVGGNQIHLDGIVIRNESTPSKLYGQAVALHVDGDDFCCENCLIESAQDTLFTGPLPKDLRERYASFYPLEKLKGLPSKQIYKHCTIKGDVDFIFGCATALFEECDIITIDANRNTPSFICAPAHSKELPYGYLFYHCSFKGHDRTYLARPWRDYGCVAIIDCKLADHILPEGYDNWNDTERDKTARFYEYTPSQKTDQRVAWAHQFTSSEAKEYFDKFISFFSNKTF